MSCPEITQEHLAIAEWAARNLARTQVGRLAGTEELISQALVALWDAALEYDEERGAFESFLKVRIKHRLIDWLRVEYGRPRSAWSSGERLRWHYYLHSLEEIAPRMDDDEEIQDFISDPAPDVEQSVLWRLELEEFARSLRAMKPIYQDAMLWPVLSDEDQMPSLVLHRRVRARRKAVRPEWSGPVKRNGRQPAAVG